MGDACRAGTGCGGCRPAIFGLLAERAEAEAPARGLSIRAPFALPLAG